MDRQVRMGERSGERSDQHEIVFYVLFGMFDAVASPTALLSFIAAFLEWAESYTTKIESPERVIEEWIEAGRLWRERGGLLRDQVERRFERESVIEVRRCDKRSEVK